MGLSATGLAAYGIWMAWQKGVRFKTELPSANGYDDDAVTEASQESFPASDAPSHTPTMGSKVEAAH